MTQNDLTIQCLEDFEKNIGAEFVGPWREQSVDRQQSFYHGTYLDLTYGETIGSQYPTGLVEGFQMLGMLDWLSAEVIGRWDGFNYGLNKVRFIRPLMVDQTIRLRLRIADVVARKGGYLVTYGAQIEEQQSSSVVMAAEWLVLLMPAEAVKGHAAS
ncbi:hypothetical protein [Rhizobium sp. ICMP 5592]|uniref:hypothetical protein n=1 Tax=Rhizobium sp. ICMP 5592 TaxID=2292445 RepID=UPI00129798EA|nr:hypothetical protein [Rhizobium sp. ICMP 5592]MQB46113.1 hypothetical protein [Rhizobium sp. ICMP 5592]